MADAKRDANYAITLIGVNINDLKTPELVAIDPATNRVLVTATVTSFTGEKASSSATTRVTTSTASNQLLAANTSRKKAVIVNESVSNLYVKYGTTASATSYTYLLQPNDTLEEYTYTGRIDGILASGSGNAEVNDM